MVLSSRLFRAAAEALGVSLLITWGIEYYFPGSWEMLSFGLVRRPAKVAFDAADSSSDGFLRDVPKSFGNVSVVFIHRNLAVIPGDWDTVAMRQAFYDVKTDHDGFMNAMEKTRNAEFIAFNSKFFDVIGTLAKVEKVMDFTGVSHVHEAPVYIPDTKEFLFSDTSVTGELFVIDVTTNKVRTIATKPPLANVNGGTYYRGKVFLCSNGGPVRGIYEFNWTDGSTVPVLNNFRGRKLNSPNDIVGDRYGNLWFTDPAYGWLQGLSSVSEPELPNAIYVFNPATGALNSVSNDLVRIPNGLAFSPDGKTLYVSDSHSISGKPLQSPHDSVRNTYAFEVRGSTLRNPWMVYQHELGWPDGIRVTESGLLVVGVAGGADVIEPETGLLLGKINTPGDIVYNLDFVPGTGTLFMTGMHHIYKATIKERSAPRP